MSWGDHKGYEYIFTNSVPSSFSFPLICGRVWSPGTGRAVPSMPLAGLPLNAIQPTHSSRVMWKPGAGGQASHWVCRNGAGSSLKECILAAQRRTCGLPGLGRKLFFSSSTLQSSHFQEMTPLLEIPEPSPLPFPSHHYPITKSRPHTSTSSPSLSLSILLTLGTATIVVCLDDQSYPLTGSSNSLASLQPSLHSMAWELFFEKQIKSYHTVIYF